RMTGTGKAGKPALQDNSGSRTGGGSHEGGGLMHRAVRPELVVGREVAVVRYQQNATQCVGDLVRPRGDVGGHGVGGGVVDGGLNSAGRIRPSRSIRPVQRNVEIAGDHQGVILVSARFYGWGD